jgi:hypothetical protein
MGIGNNNALFQPNVVTIDPVSGSLVDAGGVSYPLQRGTTILEGASAGADSGWIPMGAYGERFIYQLDSGSVSTGFTVDISVDGVLSLAQAFTGTWASSSLAEITPPLYFSNPLAKFIRWSVTSGGPLTVARSA